MSSIIARRALLSSRTISSRPFTTTARRLVAEDPSLKAQEKRNPEVFVRHIHAYSTSYLRILPPASLLPPPAN